MEDFRRNHPTVLIRSSFNPVHPALRMLPATSHVNKDENIKCRNRNPSDPTDRMSAWIPLILWTESHPIHRSTIRFLPTDI